MSKYNNYTILFNVKSDELDLSTNIDIEHKFNIKNNSSIKDKDIQHINTKILKKITNTIFQEYRKFDINIESVSYNTIDYDKEVDKIIKIQPKTLKTNDINISNIILKRYGRRSYNLLYDSNDLVLSLKENIMSNIRNNSIDLIIVNKSDKEFFKELYKHLSVKYNLNYNKSMFNKNSQLKIRIYDNSNYLNDSINSNICNINIRFKRVLIKNQYKINFILEIV